MLCIRDYDNDSFFQVHYKNLIIDHYLKRLLYNENYFRSRFVPVLFLVMKAFGTETVQKHKSNVTESERNGRD